MGMSCFLVQKWMRIINVSCFSVRFLPPAVAKPMFCVYLFAYLAAGFSEYEVTFACIFKGFTDCRLWECHVVSFKNAHAS